MNRFYLLLAAALVNASGNLAAESLPGIPRPSSRVLDRDASLIAIANSARDYSSSASVFFNERGQQLQQSALPRSKALLKRIDVDEKSSPVAEGLSNRSARSLSECGGAGISDDTACIQALLEATPAGGTLAIGKGIYLISSPLKVPTGVTVMGGGGSQGTYIQSCLSGIRTNTPTQDAFIMAAGSKLVGICIDTAVRKTAGSAVKARGINTVTIADSAIYNQFIGVDISGESGGMGPNQAVKTILRDTSIVVANNANAIAIRIGVDSTLSNTTGVYLLNNYIVCQGGNGTGTEILDAGGLFMAGNNRYGCDVGTKIVPGANQQVVWGTAGNNEILGDTDRSHALVIDTRAASAKIAGWQFIGSWTSYSGSGSTVLIQNTGEGSISGLHFNGHRFYGSPNNQTILDIKAGSGITVTGSTICASTDNVRPLVDISGPVDTLNISASTIGSCDNDTLGKIAMGVRVSSTKRNFGSISGNTFPGVMTPLTWSPTYGNATHAVIGLNKGIDDVSASVASAALIRLPTNTTMSVTGNTPISFMEGAWSNRQVKLYFPNGGSFDTKGNICKAVTLSPFDILDVTYNDELRCWLVK